MERFLMFTLYGPMQAWGGIAVGEVRATELHPSKSAVLGLLAAARGIERADDEAHAALHRGVGFAVRVEAAGTPLRDYHTAQVPSRQRKKRWHTRAEELAEPELNTILSTRDYLADAVFTVALWERDGFALEPYRLACLRPVFVPYLGRKSCPVAYPVLPRWVEADDLATAFLNWELPGDLATGIPGLKSDRRGASVYGDEPAQASGLANLTVATRWDQPASRRRWTFQPRREVHGRLQS